MQYPLKKEKPEMPLDEDDLKEMLGEGGEGCPLNNKMLIPSFMLRILRAKSETVQGVLDIAKDLYGKVESDTEKKEVFKFLKEMMKESKQTITQHDFLVAMLEDDDEEEEK